MSEIPNDEDNDHLFQDEIDVSNFVEKTFFRKSALSNEYIKYQSLVYSKFLRKYFDEWRILLKHYI